MAKKKVLLKSEEPKERTHVAAFLRELAEKVEAGAVTLQQGDQEITVSLPQIVELEIKVDEKEKRQGVKRSIEVEIEWVDGDTSGGGVTLG